jgi:glycogen operon protein
MPANVNPGSTYPLGSSFTDKGVNFCIYSPSALAMTLQFFDHADDVRPARSIELDPSVHRTFHYWHVEVPDVVHGQVYGWKASGPNDPGRGLRFDGDKLLLDPYARGVAVGANYDRAAACRPGDNSGLAMKSVAIDGSRYDWGGDRPLARPWNETIIYEMHVGGFTRHPSSGLDDGLRGTYRGLVEKIPYLQSLGITAVELLPVSQFDEQDCPPGLSNYWGYAPVSFFAPHVGYSVSGDPVDAVNEFRDMVRALHAAGIEVILDVVYNHTAEGDERGPTFSFRGLEDGVYYLQEQAGLRYSNYSGTGNTFNANHSVARRVIRDSLRYWVREMHVDGFRFDLASALTRSESGEPMQSPPLIWAIETDPVLAGTKLIAEAWDAAGLYQVGNFVGQRWTEWNGRFRDDVRDFVRGTRGAVRPLPARLLGSPDLYGPDARGPEQSINFVTAHDGFTLNDLVSYNEKHNAANREGNRDGENHNRSWNCGVEGPTDDPRIEALRVRQIKNFFAINLLSIGVPMLLMGDEVRRTQKGNNNVYCQDNELSWFDWRDVERHGEILRFVRALIGLRSDRERGMTMDDVAASGGLTLEDLVAQTRIQWHGVRLHEHSWSDDDFSIAATARNVADTRMMHVMLNSWREALSFDIPPAPERSRKGWVRVMDTSQAAPADLVAVSDGVPVAGSVDVPAHSIVLLLAELNHRA